MASERDQVEEIKGKVDIVEVIGARVNLKKAGRHFKGLCPFHSEKSPSFIVSPERQSFKCFGCFPSGSLIKSDGGLMKIEDVRENDLVFSDSGLRRPVSRLLVRNYRGGMKTIKLKKLSGKTTLTSDHKVLVVGGAPYTSQYKNFSRRYKQCLKSSEREYFRYSSKYFPVRECKAEELRVGDKLLYPIIREVVDFPEIDLSDYAGADKRGLRPKDFPISVLVDNHLLKLIGYYVAEGSSHRAYIRFSLGSTEIDLAKEIVDLIKKIFDLKASIFEQDGKKSGIEVTCCNARLARIFVHMCGKGASNKHIPYDFNLLPINKQSILLEAIWRGDGTDFVQNKSARIGRSITTISRELVIQLRDMLLRKEIFPSEHKLLGRVDKNRVRHRDSYTISWSEDGAEKYNLVYRLPTGQQYWILPIVSITETEYEGEVYNLTVETDHTYVTENFAVGNCQEGGDVLTFLQKYDGMSFLEALEMLAKKVGVTLTSYRPTSEDAGRKRLLESLSLAAEYYHFLLTKHEVGAEAREYLKKRGIGSEAIEKFYLGYAPGTWRSVSEFLVNKKKYTPEELEASGMVIRGQTTDSRFQETHYYDRFRGRVMFPLRDHKGVTVGFAGRTMSQEVKEAKYINSPETAVYHKSRMLYGLWENREAIRKADRIVIVEGELDMIPSWQAGVKEVVAIKGSALTEDHAQLIARYTRNVVVSLDADAAGQEAIKRAVNVAEKLDLSIRVVQITGGKDPGDVATANPRAWREMVGRSVLYWDFLMEAAAAKIDPRSGAGAENISREVVPALALITNAVMRAHYVTKLAGLLKVPEASIYEEIERANKKKELTYLKEKVSNIEKGVSRRAEGVALYLLALALQHFRELKEKLEGVELAWLTMPSAGKIMAQLVTMPGKELKIAEFARLLPAELQATIDQAYLRDLTGIQDVEREWASTARELEELYTRDKLKQITLAISQAERGDKAQLASLQEEFGLYSRRLTELSK